VPTQADENPAVIPLPVIFDLRRLLRWFAEHSEAIEFIDQANEITRTIRKFEIPAYEVAQDDPEVLQDIFDRMNSYGKRLRRAEIFSALFAGQESARDTTLTLERIAGRVDEDLGFGLIDNDTILQAVLARRGPDVHRQIRNEFGEDERVGASERHERTRAVIDVPAEEDRDTAYRLGEDAIHDAVLFLQNEVGVPHVTVLPYRYLLVVLTRLFAHFPAPDPRTRQLMRRWFWRAAIIGPELFRGSTSGAVRKLSYAITPGDLDGSIQRLLDLVPESGRRTPNLHRFRSNEAFTKIALCSWWSLAPRNLATGAAFERADLTGCLREARTALPAVHYVNSPNSVPKEMSLWAANRILYPTEDGELGALRSLLTEAAEQHSRSDPPWNLALGSHCLSPDMLGALKKGDQKSFLASRQVVLESQLDEFLQQRCEWAMEDTPPLLTLIVDDDDESLELSDDSS
jgi:hypothetical protein